MPRFFFHVRDAHRELSRDEFGLDFHDVETAFVMTCFAARHMRIAFTVCGRDPRDYIIEVMNAADELVFELPFSMVFDHEIVRRPILSS
ncbi:DUF6894 family protein [Microvirga rosea]|uniref:DUF6894 family protein n=1 Tax=Microvirga rosea TaxID=2715425 RepID=UPI001D0BB2F7|nr:hypothetical protein [Microvirga rosea]MCB8820593.1 hypothetical protein [Microvirga rosea]